MCGISGILAPAGTRPIAPALQRLHDRIPHRGPDGEGFAYATEHGVSAVEQIPAKAALAFRWLKIQDASESARQPFASEDGTLHLAFNGEIYNFAELRDELGALGHRFHTRSDTEVVLAAYAEWGTRCFERFRGMWAILLLDVRRRMLVASRDRFGIKPLHYRTHEDEVWFASEVKQLAGAGERLDHDTFLHFVTGGRIADRTRTFFADIRAVPPGTYAELPLDRQSTPSFVSYWSLTPNPRDLRLASAVEELHGLFREVVDLHVASEYPVGTFLSGGIDSSLITATAHELGRQLPSFSMVLGSQFGRFDEGPYIEATVKKLGISNAQVSLTGAMLRQHFDATCAAHEEPLGGLALVAQYLTYRLAASHGVRVVLDGQGSDEAFAGYGRQTYEYLLDLFVRRRWSAGTRELRAFAAADHGDTRRFLRFCASTAAQAVGVHKHLRRPQWLELTKREFSRITATGEQAVRDAPSGTRLAKVLYADTMSLNLYDVLGIGDRNSMAHSIESRVPFVDHRLIEFAFSLPDEVKISGGWRKRVLRELASHMLPPEVAWRRDKMGFAVPQARWMRESFRDVLSTLHQHPRIAASRLFDAGAVANLSAQFLAGDDAVALPLWRIYASAEWAARYSVELG